MDKSLLKFYKNKRVLITGATGFKGSWLSLWLKILGAEVCGIGYNPNKNKNLFYSLKLDKIIKLKIVDVRKKKELNKIIKSFRPQIIFHLAAQPLIYESFLKPYSTYYINTIGTLNILEVVRENKFVKSLICITSDKCYENNYSTKGFKENDKLGGEDPYSGSKACAEIVTNTYIKSFFSKSNTLGVATARAGNVIGGGDWSPKRLIPDTVNSIVANKTIYLRNPKFNRPWQHVLEPLWGYLLLAKKLYFEPKKYSGPWNFGTTRGTITNVLEIVKKIILFWGKGKVKFNKKNKFYEQENLQLNINKARQKLKWKPKYSVTQSVKVTTEWYKKILIDKNHPLEITKEQIKDYMKR